MTHDREPPSRFYTIDGTRGIGALLVMSFHFTDSGFAPFQPFPNCLFVLDYFWCISGFVLAFIYGEPLARGMPISSFMGRRLARFLPTSLIGNLLGIFVLLTTPLANHGTYIFFIAALLSLAFLPPLRPLPVEIGSAVNPDMLFPMNAPLWSLSFEFAINWIYAVARPRTRPLVVIVLASAFFLWLTVDSYETPPGPNLSTFPGALPRCAFAFFSGVLAFRLWQRFPPRLPAWWPAALCVLMVAISILPFSPLGYVASVLAVPVMVWSAATNPSTQLERRLYSWLGEISYPVYALHFPILLWVHARSGGEDPTRKTFIFAVAVMACVILVSSLIARYVEVPVRQRLYRLFGARKTGASGPAQ